MGGQVKGLSVQGGGMLFNIQLKPAHPVYGLGTGKALSVQVAERHTDARHQLCGGKGLGQVIIRSQIQKGRFFLSPDLLRKLL